MRKFVLIATVLAAAGCSEEAPQQNNTAEAAATELQPGQWEATSEVTRVTSKDEGTPVIKVGEKKVISMCIPEGQGKKPGAALLTGMDEGTCSYDTLFMSRGRINGNVTCNRPDLGGRVVVNANGTFKGDSFDLESDLSTLLAGEGDVDAVIKVNARRTGECPAEAAGAAS